MEPIDESVEHTVGVVAHSTGVSVRTLHHYDEIGLLEPSGRSATGYRLYSDADLQRLQRILFYRELDFGLDDIASMLDDAGLSDEDHLRRQRDLLRERIARHQAMVAVVEKELAARESGIALTPAERLEVFGGDRLVDSAAEAERRWGHTPEFAQRRERTAQYSKQEWLDIRAEQREIHQGLADAMRAGIPAADPAVMDLAERHRRHLERWFHDCDHATHRQLAEEYRANRRLGRNYDDMAPGLSLYIHDAIVANGRRHDGMA
ncbi:DNA-binding transcriptional MerR regulator [Nocardia transvalensis]|uniref:DNA-binding transcriptional MerR regulator n=1 Tax=Nocardia transvalensis TaxID=37333 RepID=A0A7W9PJT2_9NOCA|nr:MerR family transcriptional regulator [Nocardia transvalensis]MBB5917331.1 DNA-binding transcriptional MerR regulator [Nocardia transvalensis]